MLQAQRKFDLLAQRASPEVLAQSIEHARSVYLTKDMSADLVAQFEAAADSLTRSGTMTSDARRGWDAFRRRVVDAGVSAVLERISDTLVVGATSGGEVSTATLAFPDGSHLIMMDHGLANLTWLAAELHVVSRRTPLLGQPPPGDAVDVGVAARTLRLAASRISAGGRAGTYPSLVLTPDELALAGALVNEMDIFIMGHEAAHILLGHFGKDRLPLGVIGGSNQLMGKRRGEETAADLLAITMQFDDMLSAERGAEHLVELRIAAVRLFLAALGLYERSTFVVQPASHPPSAARWKAILRDRLSLWFGDLDMSLSGTTHLLDALSDMNQTPRLSDAAEVHTGLGERLDTKLWSFRDWSSTAVLGHYLHATAAQALDALRRWPGWAVDTDVPAEIANIVGGVLGSDQARAIVKTAATGTQTISRLDAVQTLAPVADALLGPVDHPEPFPNWAVAAIVLEALSSAVSARPTGAGAA